MGVTRNILIGQIDLSTTWEKKSWHETTACLEQERAGTHLAVCKDNNSVAVCKYCDANSVTGDTLHFCLIDGQGNWPHPDYSTLTDMSD